MNQDAGEISPLGRAALAYAARFGWAVFPLAARAKVPRIARKDGGKGFLDATTDPGMIRDFWRRFPDANVGVATGRRSAFVAFDVDPRNGGEMTLEEFETEHGKLPHTVLQQTGSPGGFHALFSIPQGVRLRSCVLGSGIELKADGGYIAMTPSIHPNGREYVWEASSRPGEVVMAELPPWVIALASRSGLAQDDRPRGARGAGAKPSAAPGLDARQSYLGVMFEAAGMLGDLIPDTKQEFGRRKVLCPWRAEHTTGRDYDSSTILFMPTPGYTHGFFRCSHRCKTRSRAELLLAMPTAAKEAARRAYPEPNRTRPPRQAPAPASTQRGAGAAPAVSALFQRGSDTEIARHTIDALESGPLTWDEGEFWRYTSERGVWDRLPAEVIESTIMGFDGVTVRTSERSTPLSISANKVTGGMRLARSLLVTRPGRVTFHPEPAGVAFANGFVTLDAAGALEVRPHAPAHRARHALPFDYEPNAPREKLLEFLEEVFGDCDEQEKADRVACLQEFIGGALLGLSTKYEKALLLTGTGGNGKSQILALAEAVFPPGTVAHLPPQDWGERFRTVSLVGMRANFVPEIPSSDLTASNVLKSVITGEVIYAEKKGRDVFSFVPCAGHIFSANMLPSTRDTSEGFFRRFAILSLTRKFSDSAARVEHLGRSIAEAELPGLVAWALAGAVRLEQQRNYTLPEGSRREWEQWREDSDHIRGFLASFDWKTYGSPARGGGVAGAAFYDHYRDWCQQNGFGPVTSTTFGKRAETTGLVVKRIWQGFRMYSPAPRPGSAS